MQKIIGKFLVIVLLISLIMAPETAGTYNGTLERLAGANRFETAVKVSQNGWYYAHTVILARGDDFADALAGVPLAYSLNAPILLTGSNSLHSATREELRRLGTSRVIILGGTGAVSSEVEQELTEMYLQVERIAGSDRFHTAALIAEQVSFWPGTAILVNGRDFPDGLCAAPYAARAGYPILLVEKNKIPQATIDLLKKMSIYQVIVVGGTGVVSEASLQQLPETVYDRVRVAGLNRYATAAALAQYFNPPTDSMYIATGLDFADTITGAALAAQNNSGILLVNAGVPPEVKSYLSYNLNIEHLVLLGGEGAVSAAIASSLQKILARDVVSPPVPPANQSITHRVKNGIIYGLDYWRNEVRLTEAPADLPDGEYVVDKQLNFFQSTGAGLVFRRNFNYLELIPYALLELDSPADARVTASFLQENANRVCPGTCLAGLGDAFLRAQDTWGVNALYLLAHAALESGWGNSQISKLKHNIYGFTAYDRDPFRTATTFRNKADCILYVSAYIRRAYLSEAGSYYRGANLAGMNVFYASDPMWFVKIARTMDSLLPYAEYTPAVKEHPRGEVNLFGLNLHSGPGYSRDIIGSLSYGDELEIEDMVIIGSEYWFKVKAAGGSGWVCGEYIRLTSPARGAVYITGWHLDDSYTLNIRSGPGTDHSVVGSLRFGDKVTITDLKMVNQVVWYRIDYEGSYTDSWISGDYIIVDW